MRNPEDQIRLVYDRVPLIIRLPFAFRKMGLGDVIGHALWRLGLRPSRACRCNFRKAVLNSYLIFYGWNTPLPEGPFSRWNPEISREMIAQGTTASAEAAREA
jgi:hypothetical protein